MDRVITKAAPSEQDMFDRLNDLTRLIEEGNSVAVNAFLTKHNLAFLNKRDRNGETPLCVAAEKGFLEAVALLVIWGADLEATDKANWTPLMCAASSNSVEVVEYLIKKGALVERAEGYEGWGALTVAAFKGSNDVLRILLENGAVWDRRDGILQTGHTAYEYAKINEQTEACDILKNWPLELERRERIKSEEVQRQEKIATLKQHKQGNPIKFG